MQLGFVPRRWDSVSSISGLVVEYIVAIDVARVRFPADALFECRTLLLNTPVGDAFIHAKINEQNGGLRGGWKEGQSESIRMK